MKSYLKHWELTLDFVKTSIYECLNNNNRWKRVDTALMFAEYVVEYCKQYNAKPVHLHLLAKNIHRVAILDKTKLYKLVDYIAECILEEIKTRTIHFPPIRYDIRKDGSSMKEREIGLASMKQQLYDYIMVNACKPVFNNKIGYYQCASLKGKGQLFGKNSIEYWIRSNPKKCKYWFKGDIRKCYPSVNHDILKSLLSKHIKNDDILYGAFTLINSYKQGLCIGSYFCQFLANFYLSFLYHFITEKLFKIRRGKLVRLITHCLIYMDDIFITASNLKDLKLAIKLIKEYLKKELDLELKDNYEVQSLNTKPIDIMGYKIYPSYTTVRKRIFDRANKVFMTIKRRNFKMNLALSQKVVSYWGYFKHSFAFKFRHKMKLDKIVVIAKQTISNYAKGILVY